MTSRGATILGLVPVGVNLVLLLAMAWLRARVPFEADLYNLVYDDARPHKGEDTDVFLFGFPALSMVGSLLFAASIRTAIGEDDDKLALKLILPVGVFAIFALGTMARFRTVAASYGV